MPHRTGHPWDRRHVDCRAVWGCIYLAQDEVAILKHAELSGIPVTRITEAPQIIDPLTANN